MAKRALKNWMTSYVRYTKENESPSCYNKWTGLSVLAGALERKCWLPWGGLYFYPNLYAVLVGHSGTRKSNAMYFGQQVFNPLGLPIGPDSTTKEALIDAQREVKRECRAPDGKMRRHSSLTVFSTELQALLGTRDTEFLAFMCAWYDTQYDDWTRGWTHRTRYKQKETIFGGCLNFLGGTTPHLIEEMMPPQVIHSGFCARVTWVFSEETDRKDPRQGLSDEELNLKRLLTEDLQRINKITGPFTLNGPALDYIVPWYETQDDRPPVVAGRIFDGYCERRCMNWLKLGMIHSAARGDSRIVTLEDLTETEKILRATELVMPRVFDQYGQSPAARQAERIMDELKERGTLRTEDIATMVNDFGQLKGLVCLLDNRPDVRKTGSHDRPVFHYKGRKSDGEKKT